MIWGLFRGILRNKKTREKKTNKKARLFVALLLQLGTSTALLLCIVNTSLLSLLQIILTGTTTATRTVLFQLCDLLLILQYGYVLPVVPLCM